MSRDEIKSLDGGLSLDKNVGNLLFRDFRERNKRFLGMEILLQLEL